MSARDFKYPFLSLKAANAEAEDTLVQAAERVIRSGRYVGGEEVSGLENALGAAADGVCAVGVSNGLDALRLILRAYIELGELHPGDEVLVPGNTYIASILAVSDCGLVPVPVDADPVTLNMDTSLIDAAVTPRTRAIMTVHLYGRICFDDEMRRAATRHSLKIVEDCAQAFGARTLSGRAAGALGHAAGLSFYPTKNFGALGDAGAVLTSDPVLARTVRALANYGTDRQYHNIYRGYNCRLDSIQAAMLHAKLPGLEAENLRRRAVARAYDETIDNTAVVKPLCTDGPDMIWHQYVVLVPCRDSFREWLEANGVETAVHYPTAPHRQPCYPGLARGPLPVAERIAAECVSLPIGAETTPDDARVIAEIINQYRPA